MDLDNLYKNKLEEYWWAVVRGWNKFFRFIKNILRGLKSICIWWKIIYDDRQWSELYLLDMIEKKLSLMQKYYEEGKNVWACESNFTIPRKDSLALALEQLMLFKDNDWEPDYTPTRENWDKYLKDLNVLNIERKESLRDFCNIFIEYIDEWSD